MSIQTKLALVLPLCILVGSAVLNILATAKISDIGSQLYALDVKYEQIKKKNDLLEVEVSQKLSVARLQEEATTAGFVPRTSVVSVTKGTQLAKQ